MNLASRILSGANMDDTGQNAPERPDTLAAQQDQVSAGRKTAVMFPRGTPELAVQPGMERIDTPRGAFHFNPRAIGPEDILRLSDAGRENQVLGLGPFNKDDIARRVAAGEPPVAIVERTPEGKEVKSAVGTHLTAPQQQAAFEASKTPGNIVSLEPVDSVLSDRGFRRGGGIPHFAIRTPGIDAPHVGPIKSPVAGRTDHIPLKVPANSFVIPADVVSGLGQGNTDAGHKVLTKMFPNVGHAAGGGVPAVDIMAAGGEHVISPEECASLGGGDVEEGHRILDAFVRDQRKRLVKTLSKLPGPVKG
jgi:hypothetical protein